MKKLLALTIAALALLALTIPLAADDNSESAKDEVTWYKFQEGWNKAQAENKHLFVDFTATWCKWCKELERTTFKDPKVVEMLNESFVPVKVWEKTKDTIEIDGYRFAESDLMRGQPFRVRGFPTLYFLSPDRQPIGPVGRGYVTADQLLEALEIVKFYRYDSTRNEQGELINPPVEDKTPTEGEG